METEATRLQVFRKSLKPRMTREAFGKVLGVSRDTLFNFEGGRARIPETFIKLLCLKYPINETWLRTGEGEMIDHEKENVVSRFAVEMALPKEDTEFLHAFFAMPREQRIGLINFLRHFPQSQLSK